MQVQCDLVITRFTYVNVCSLNCLNLFLKYKNWLDLLCVCVCVCVCMCVFRIYVLKIVVERWFWELKMLFGSLVELHTWLHSYLCFSLLEKLFLSNLDTSLTLGYLSSFSSSSYRNLDSFSTTRWIDQDFFWILDSFLTASGSIELPLAFCWFVPRQILDSCIYRCWFSQHLP